MTIFYRETKEALGKAISDGSKGIESKMAENGKQINDKLDLLGYYFKLIYIRTRWNSSIIMLASTNSNAIGCQYQTKKELFWLSKIKS